MSYLIMLFLISLLVILHEVGHMVVAQRCGVKVERFGLGLPFGPTLLEKEWKGIKWCLHILPLGGYVSFPDDNECSTLAPDSPQRFQNQPLPPRGLVRTPPAANGLHGISLDLPAVPQLLARRFGLLL